jgi:hypothetical protein
MGGVEHLSRKVSISCVLYVLYVLCPRACFQTGPFFDAGRTQNGGFWRGGAGSLYRPPSCPIRARRGPSGTRRLPSSSVVIDPGTRRSDPGRASWHPWPSSMAGPRTRAGRAIASRAPSPWPARVEGAAGRRIGSAAAASSTAGGRRGPGPRGTARTRASIVFRTLPQNSGRPHSL